MKIIKGYNKSQFINDYCNRNKEIQFLLIDTIGNTFSFECDNLMLISNANNWVKELIYADEEFSKDVEFILFTNDEICDFKKYKNILEDFNREIFLVLKADCEAILVEGY